MESSSSSQNGPVGGQFQGPGFGPTSAAARTPAAHIEHLAKQADARRQLSRASDRARLWFAVRVVALCWLSALAGLVPMGWALHTTNLEAGRMAWAVGQFGGSFLIVVTLVVAWMKWERDDW